MSDATFAKSHLTEVWFIESKFFRTDFQNAWISFGGFIHSELYGANFDNAHLGEPLSFRGCTMRGATFRNAILNNLSFMSVDLTGADFSGASALDGFRRPISLLQLLERGEHVKLCRTKLTDGSSLDRDCPTQ